MKGTGRWGGRVKGSTLLLGFATLYVGSVVMKGKNLIKMRNKRKEDAGEESTESKAFSAQVRRWSDQESSRKAVVVGGGLAGLCSAWGLSRRGYNVLLIERREAPGIECSAAAAGGMQVSNVEIGPSQWIKTVKNMLQPSFGSSFKYFYIKWSKIIDDEEERKHKSKELLKFTDWSIELLRTLIESEPLSNKIGLEQGALKVFRSKADLEISACLLKDDGESVEFPESKNSPSKQMKAIGEPREIIDDKEVFDKEPWLKLDATKQDDIVGAIYEPFALRGNSEWFSKKFAECLENSEILPIPSLPLSPEERRRKKGSVQFSLGTSIIGFEYNESDKERTVTAIHTNKGTILLPKGSPVVIATGASTPLIMRQLKLFVPMYPLKGYVLKYNTSSKERIITEKDGEREGNCVPHLKNIVNDGPIYLAGYKRPGDDVSSKEYVEELRVASIGEYSGWDLTPDPAIVSRLKRRAEEIIPSLAQYAPNIQVGLRPFMADGVPLIGKVDTFNNVYINSGPGFNGWKMCIGGGELLARKIDNPQSLMELNFDASVLDPASRVRYAPITTSYSVGRHSLWDV